MALIDRKTPAGPDRSAFIVSNRLLWLDLARTLALLAMIVFHFARDLELFGFLPSGTTATGGWAIFARVIAGFFVFLSGVSLVVAHSADFNPRNWAKRIALISGAALLVTMATYVVFPEQFIYFGILHCIAACSIVGGFLVRAPATLLCTFAVLILVAGTAWDTGIFASPWLAWTGLTLATRPSLDYLPMIPWFSSFLAGMAFAKVLPLTTRDLTIRSKIAAQYTTLLGRHSLAIYLVHQPVLLAIIWVAFALA
ncbi:DUF1624 domain-containing protein [Ruegeria sp. WL0004]|uniref:DUF1624 domain-containing protein n=1 Tax=Ruegeria marisflavi TaxID=2984152 RepID=A0ABT2WX54_9RHOB|nr:heparan-alpha-glucosaminide N-acetyltransferase [Ruegeria sp. WL0004]MCU9840479.1 DUF1624 domain-containing protein [Ruegeria sp. WL0004]